MAVTVKLKNIDALSYLIYLLEGGLHSLSLARSVLASASKSVGICSSRYYHGCVGVTFLYTLVVHDVLWVVLPSSNQINKLMPFKRMFCLNYLLSVLAVRIFETVLRLHNAGHGGEIGCARQTGSPPSIIIVVHS